MSGIVSLALLLGSLLLLLLLLLCSVGSSGCDGAGRPPLALLGHVPVVAAEHLPLRVRQQRGNEVRASVRAHQPPQRPVTALLHPPCSVHNLSCCSEQTFKLQLRRTKLNYDSQLPAGKHTEVWNGVGAKNRATKSLMLRAAATRTMCIHMRLVPRLVPCGSRLFSYDAPTGAERVSKLVARAGLCSR